MSAEPTTVTSVNRRRSVLTLSWYAAWSGGLGLSLPAWAQSGPVVYEGQNFDRQMAVAGVDLQLNGTGTRQVAWFKGYLAALYLTTPAGSAEQAVATKGPKRIQLRLLHDVPATEFAKAVRKGMLRNLAAAQHGAVSERLDKFVRQIEAIGKVRKGDVVNLDLEPSRGLALYVNAVMRGEPIPGEDFYSALLLSFVGERPYDERMRAGLLGKPG